MIKKYKNRRLYDLENSQYITVDDLQNYVLEGLPFQVIDAASKKDITNATLLQIFVEMESQTSAFLSGDVLRQLIIFAHHPMSKSFKSMLEQSLSLMERQLQQIPYLHDYQKMTEEFMSQWQKIFKH